MGPWLEECEYMDKMANMMLDKGQGSSNQQKNKFFSHYEYTLSEGPQEDPKDLSKLSV